MAERDRVLAILAGYPYGATEAALAEHGISRACLDALVTQGLISVNGERFALAPRGHHQVGTQL
jgi:hypothetical protein